ncbi:MAG: hypothetical protein P8X74_00405 [Reinekea sp.]
MARNLQSSPLLYLYGSAQLIAALKRGRLPLQRDWAFVEPFLSLHRWSAGVGDHISESELQTGFRREYEKLPDNIRMWLSFDDFLAQRDRLEVQVRSEVLASRQHRQVDAYPAKRFEKSACLRLFDSATCYYGWSILAEHFTGIAVAIRKQATCLQPMPGAPVILDPVQYGTAHEFHPSEDNPLPGAFFDVEENRLQGEWRAIVPARDSDSVMLKFKRNDIQRIYVSVLTPYEIVSEIKQLIQQDLNFRHVDLFRVSPDAVYWRLTADRIEIDS